MVFTYLQFIVYIIKVMLMNQIVTLELSEYVAVFWLANFFSYPLVCCRDLFFILKHLGIQPCSSKVWSSVPASPVHLGELVRNANSQAVPQILLNQKLLAEAQHSNWRTTLVWYSVFQILVFCGNRCSLKK